MSNFFSSLTNSGCSTSHEEANLVKTWCPPWQLRSVHSYMCASKRNGRELFPGPAAEQDGVGWSASTWRNFPLPNTRMFASKLTTGMARASAKPRTTPGCCLGLAGCFGPKSLLETSPKTSLHSWPSTQIHAVAPLSYSYGCNLCGSSLLIRLS